jgi:LysM repeat protein
MATPTDASRDAKVKAKEDAIKRRLEKGNSANRSAALKSAQADAKKAAGTGKTISKTYKNEVINKGGGYAKSDYGVDVGAAIPWKTNVQNAKVAVTATKKKAPEKKKKSTNSGGGGHSVYKVKKGDTLSGIAKKYGISTSALWNYNLKNRKASTVKTLKKRGPNLIYRGGTFYIPKKK